LRRARFHAGGPSDHFGADLGNDRDVSGLFELRVPVTGDRNRFRALRAGELEGGDREWSASAGSDAYHDVVFARLSLCDFPSPQLAGIFIGFDSSAQSFRSAGDDELDEVRVRVKCGRAFGGVERGDASAGAGAYVEEASTLGEGSGNEINGLGDLRECALHGGSDLGVFGIDNAGDLKRGLTVEVNRGGIAFLRDQATEIGSNRAALQAFFSNASMASITAL
jgi:hypothetical protein